MQPVPTSPHCTLLGLSLTGNTVSQASGWGQSSEHTCSSPQSNVLSKTPLKRGLPPVGAGDKTHKSHSTRRDSTARLWSTAIWSLRLRKPFTNVRHKAARQGESAGRPCQLTELRPSFLPLLKRPLHWPCSPPSGQRFDEYFKCLISSKEEM